MPTHKPPSRCLPSQVTLYIVNTLYLLLAIGLISVASVAKAQAYVSTLPLLAGVLFAGVFLLFVSLLGIIGTAKQSNPTLLAYMILLVLLFIIQFFVSVFALAITDSQQQSLAESGWCHLDDIDKGTLQRNLNCYGFQAANYTKDNCMAPGGAYSECTSFNATETCDTTSCSWMDGKCYYSGCSRQCVEPEGSHCPPAFSTPEDLGAPLCQYCFEIFKNDIHRNMKWAGGVGLAFAFTEFIGIWAAWRFRSNKAGNYRYERVFI